ncbi:MAG TPA: hypothetical protein VL687_01275 [Methylomirabilota bacterium]|nr:hypothetical protein [Methylomirabilota bacterium]
MTGVISPVRTVGILLVVVAVTSSATWWWTSPARRVTVLETAIPAEMWALWEIREVRSGAVSLERKLTMVATDLDQAACQLGVERRVRSVSDNISGLESHALEDRVLFGTERENLLFLYVCRRQGEA